MPSTCRYYRALPIVLKTILVLPLDVVLFLHTPPIRSPICSSPIVHASDIDLLSLPLDESFIPCSFVSSRGISGSSRQVTCKDLDNCTLPLHLAQVAIDSISYDNGRHTADVRILNNTKHIDGASYVKFHVTYAPHWLSVIFPPLI
jgi:hypothetical protein